MTASDLAEGDRLATPERIGTDPGDAQASTWSGLWRSRFVRNAVSLVFLNATAKALMFCGNIYAARCLGPVNLGISANILAFGQQSAVIYNGGFDPIAVREVAAEPARGLALTRPIVLFRFLVSLACFAVWSAITLYLHSDPLILAAWSVGGLLMVLGALNITFVFQGLEKLPIQAVASFATGLLTAGGYFLFFHPGMPVGSDLIVTLVATVIPLAALWWYYLKRVEPSGLQAAPLQHTVAKLMPESWHYWALAAVVYGYSGIQIPLVTLFLGEREAGIYRTAVLFANGLYLLYSSVNSLFLARFVIWKKAGLEAMWQRQKKLAYLAVCVGLPVTALIVALAPWVYRTFLGVKFSGGDFIFQVLAVQTLVVFVGQVFAWGLTAKGEHLSFLKASALGALVCISANPIVAPRFGIRGVAFVSLSCEVIIHGACWLYALRYIQQNRSGAKSES